MCVRCISSVYIFNIIIRYYNSLPPVAKTYATVCLVTSLGGHLQLYSPAILALYYEDVFKRFQVKIFLICRGDNFDSFTYYRVPYGPNE
ncbi:hypothetical protein HanLR1_Chr14g0554171 [Helianthus annuus]|nr:hypothetical protein HanLR1_Chr14g0554171 [Helianthus annuus]